MISKNIVVLVKYSMILRSDTLKDKKIQFEVCKMKIIDFACAQIAKKMERLKEIWTDLK